MSENEIETRVTDETACVIDRCVTMYAFNPGPKNAACPIVVSVGLHVHAAPPELAAQLLTEEQPNLRLQGVTWEFTRKQWEALKRLGDQAWAEYEKRFPK